MKDTRNNKDNKDKIKKEDNLADIVFRHPEVAEILMDYGLHCVGCAFSAADTLEQGAKIHGLSAEDIEQMVVRANEVIATGE
jgi:hybrid cluster-associated redox disulfide protein